tara:strand:+ start:16 stop:765 length:750 start_codon:yes stop_codon:yes gene_type:complete
MLNITKKLITASAFCFSSIFATAQEGGTVSGSVSFDYNSHFMSSGIDVWSTGNSADSLFQPSASLDFNYGDYGFYTGVWFDINDEVDSTIGGDIQEVDVWVGGYYTAGAFTFDLALQQWYYGGECEGIVDFTVSYDTVLAPYARLRTRIEGVGDTDTGSVLEVGGGYDINEILSVPFAVAYAISDDFAGGDDGLAYVTTGLGFGYPLEFLTGDWDIHGGVSGFYVPDDYAPGNPDETFLTYSVGMGLSF